MAALHRDAGWAEAHFLLGVLAAEHGKFQQAADAFLRAATLGPGDARYQAHLGKALVAIGRRDEGNAAAARAAELGPRDALTLDTIGVVYSFAGRHADAVAFFAKAVAAEPGNANFHYNLGVSQQFSGAFVQAAASFRRVLELEQGRRRAMVALVQLEKQTRDDNFAPVLEAQFEKERDDANARLHLGHALAKTYEDIGDPIRALHWLKEAKAMKIAASGFSIDEEARLFDAAAEAARTVRGKPGFDSNAPIFVVGMPRTGTTLVDRILSQHADVVSAGELDYFSTLLKQAAGASATAGFAPGVFAAASNFDMMVLGRDYIAATRARAAASPHFVDKMPRNFLLAGLILTALPQARVICLRRHPMDACLSNYRQMFNAESVYYRYAYDLEDSARYYVLFDKLVAHWRRTLPADRFTEVQYEGLVGDLEAETRRLLAFCGLEWDSRCLDFHENEAPVATASSVQVRSPIYASSIGRWRAYGDALDPMRRILEAAGLDVN